MMLADFASLPLPELTAELERMQRTLAPSTSTAAPVLPPVAPPSVPSLAPFWSTREHKPSRRWLNTGTG